MIISHRIHLRMRNVPKKYRENPHILCSITFFLKSYRLWESMEKCGRARQATDDNIRCMHIPCWITKATDIHSEYVTLIALPRQQWLRERASMLRLYVHCLLQNELIMYVSVCKHLLSFHNCFGITTRLCQGKGYMTSHFRCLHQQHDTVSRAFCSLAAGWPGLIQDSEALLFLS